MSDAPALAVDMSDADPAPSDTSIKVAESVVGTAARGQLRLALSGLAGAIAGSAFGQRYLPPGLFSDALLDAITAIIIYAATARWQWARNRIQHSRFWMLAINPRVPNDLVRPAPIKGEAP